MMTNFNSLVFIVKQLWLWSYKALGTYGSGSSDNTIVCCPKDMSVEKYVLISQKY